MNIFGTKIYFKERKNVDINIKDDGVSRVFQSPTWHYITLKLEKVQLKKIV